jgi:hypothetical protein
MSIVTPYCVRLPIWAYNLSVEGPTTTDLLCFAKSLHLLWVIYDGPAKVVDTIFTLYLGEDIPFKPFVNVELFHN